MMLLLASLLTCILALTVNSYKHFQTAIPNGENVRHPCNGNKIWQGVGHMRQLGGGSTNSFGTDFLNAGKKWTRALCMKDSDGDGKTNGQELGDPSCTWAKGKTPSSIKDITHPGVCEPLSSATCKKKNAGWDICASDTLNCPSIKEPNVTSITLRFKNTTVPSNVTNYYCQAFVVKLPTNQDYHMIAHEPLIDNAELMHHALMFGCTDSPDAALFKAPRRCGMGGANCQQLIALWSLGSPGECLPKHFGMKFGPKGYKYLVVQYHWNNVGQRSDLTDASAFRFYFTPDLRPHNGAVMVAGQRYLELPPGQNRVVMEATCSSDCTGTLTRTVNFTDIFPHMHYSGTHAEAAHYRNGTKLRDLLKYQVVKYDEPKKISFAEPIEFRPGDVIKMKCYYKTTHSKETLYYGDSTQDEMCFIFVSYYPAIKFPYCLNYGPIDTCGGTLKKNGGKYGIVGRIDKCNAADFLLSGLNAKWVPMLDEFCDYSITACRSGCMNVLKRMLKEEPCWKGWAKKYFDFLATYSTSLAKVRLQLDRCQMVLDLQQNSGKREEGKSEKTTIILLSVAVGFVLLVLLVVAVFLITRTIRAANSQIPNNESEKTQGFYNNAYDLDTARKF